MVPEKGRNARLALERELADEAYDTEWLADLINERGKRAAKTGEGVEEVAEYVDAVEDLLSLNYYGRAADRPVFNQIEFTNRRVEGYESPDEAWRNGATRFYAGFDELLETALRRGDGVEVADGFEAAVRAVVEDHGYDLEARLGDEVTWAAMAVDAVPDRPATVLVPEAFRELGTALADVAFEAVGDVRTFEDRAEAVGRPDADEEALLADAGPDVAGVYMYVSGATADAHGLARRPVPGAVSRLGVFASRDGDGTTMTIESLKGFYDRYPEEFAAWREVIDTVEGVAREFGFREVNTPAVERTDLYRVKSGDELLDQTYSFEDRSDREVTLTPEQTPTRARMVQQRKDLMTPIKWVDTSKRWRYENVQRGRDREFFQTDVDVFGVESVAADAEVIAVGATAFRRLGVGDRVEFLVSDRTLLESLLEAHGVRNTTEVMRVVDDREKLDRGEYLDQLRTRGLDDETAREVADLTAISGPLAETLDELRERAPDDERAAAAIDRMADLADALESHGVADMCTLDLSIVRGLAYYTGLVFEAFDSEGDLRALFGGGRYDDLVGLFGERDVPAVGFAFGYSTTRELLRDAGEWPAEDLSTDVYVLNVSADLRDVALDYARDLREAGLTVETDLTGRSVGSQFSYADSVNADWAVVVGERDLSEGVVTVQDMDSGEEERVDEDGVVEFFRAQGLL